MIGKELKSQIDTMSYQDQDDIYRYLWHRHVMDDVRCRAEDNGIDLTEGQIDCAASKYVYDGDYDCNLDYWSNIDNVIDCVVD